MEKRKQTALPGAEVVSGMTPDELRELVRDISRQGMTRKVIAEEAGYRDSALSAWMNKKYSVKDMAFEVALRSALERILERRFMSGNREAKKFRRVKTSVVEAVFSTAKICQFQGLIGLLTGKGGRGKTTAAEMYRTSVSNVIYVRTSRFMTRKHLMQAIAKQVGVDEKSAYDMLVKVCEKLRRRKSLVIVDEAENISLDLLDTVRQINDWANAGLLFIGQEAFYDTLARARPSHEYLVDRFKLRMRVKDLGLVDVRMLAETELLLQNSLEKALLRACNGSARFLETLVFKLVQMIDDGLELDERLIVKTADAVKIF
ncbi:ATP-binding protein [Prosthecochloris sp. SCSIO W1101]|uniref:ATP-binding protein n=1 Tax=Prosthecochloris sp. SCSIO W1101 TaxID=2992242 RepID=UPI00223D90ED|nr:ATP-binding protein [Prosthecochloris sp. SCSIO W1101]UZJ41142.1 ATP-binding protein [Prosthecochloris sp. SCSIO W1101]